MREETAGARPMGKGAVPARGRGADAGSTLLRVAAAGLAGGALATGGELLGWVDGLRPGEALGIAAFGAAGGLVLAAGLGLGLGVLGTLAGRRLRAASPQGLAVAVALLAVGLALAFFLGERLGPGHLRATTFGAPLLALLFALAVAGLVGTGPGRGGDRAAGAVLAVAALALVAPAASAAREAGASGLALALGTAGAAAAVGLALLAGRAPRAAAALALAGLAAVGLATWRSPAPPAARAQPPAAPPGSAVVIVLDTVRADALGAYGGTLPTPAFDAFAGEGMLVEEVISPGPWTVPSHATLFTGLVPHDHGAWYGGRPWLDDGLRTLAERYRDAGFETAAFYTNGWLRTANLLQGFEVAEDSVRRPFRQVTLLRALRWPGLGPEHWIDKGAAETVAAVGRWAARRDPERPFFLFVNLLEAHGPYLPPRAYRRLPDGLSQLGAIRAHRGHEFVTWHEEGVSGTPRARAVAALYRAGVAFQDAVLGRLLEALAGQVDLAEATIVVTSDHGENLGEGGRWNHLFATNGALTHVPLALRGPGIPAGLRVPGPFQTLDLPGTLAARSGLPDEPPGGPDAPTPGPEDTPRLLTPDAAPRAATYAEVHPAVARLGGAAIAPGERARAMRTPAWTVRQGGYSLTRHGDGAVRLYDLARDPAEARDVAAGHPPRRARMLERLEAWAESPAAPASGGTPEDDAPSLSPEERERLRELGYL